MSSSPPPIRFARLRNSLLASLSLILFACQATRPGTPAPSPQEVAGELPAYRQALASITSADRDLQRDFLRLRATGGWKTRGYFTAEESDRVELLLFRFHTAHHHLNDIVEHCEIIPAGSPDAPQAVSLRTEANQLAHARSEFLVNSFAGDKVAITKLNQAFPRSNIPQDTYNRLVESLEPAARRKAGAVALVIKNDLHATTYAAQSRVFYRVSRLRKPNAHTVQFSQTRKQEVLSRLQPGDLLLTYTAGYASDVFIPGAFKHGITYVGSVAERHAAGLSPDRITLVGGQSEGRKINVALRQGTTASGKPANVIEAVAEGVKFSNLEHIMDTHVNRLLVLRPNLDPGTRARQVGRTFSYLGQEYDFRFDFADASRQVCTEVIYRALNGLKGINFPLTRRGGHATLSADDLVNYWLHDQPDAFSFVLYAEEDPSLPGHQARVLTGTAGEQRLRALMADGGRE